MYALGRPQRAHRFRTRVGYFRLVSRTIMLFFAKTPPYLYLNQPAINPSGIAYPGRINPKLIAKDE